MQIYRRVTDTQAAKVQHTAQSAICEQQVLRNQVAVIPAVWPCIRYPGQTQSLFPDRERSVKLEIEAVDQSEQIAIFFDDYFEDQLLHNPETATRLGRSTGMSEWSDLSDDGTIQNVIRTQAWLTRLQSEFDYDTLSTADQVSYLLFEEQRL